MTSQLLKTVGISNRIGTISRSFQPKISGLLPRTPRRVIKPELQYPSRLSRRDVIIVNFGIIPLLCTIQYHTVPYNTIQYTIPLVHRIPLRARKYAYPEKCGNDADPTQTADDHAEAPHWNCTIKQTQPRTDGLRRCVVLLPYYTSVLRHELLVSLFLLLHWFNTSSHI